MRWIVALSAIALAVVDCGRTDRRPVQRRCLASSAIQQSDLRRDLTYISSDELGGPHEPAAWR